MELNEETQTTLRSINLNCEVYDPENEVELDTISISIPLNHEDIAATKFEGFIKELAEVVSEYIISREPVKRHTVYPH